MREFFGLIFFIALLSLWSMVFTEDKLHADAAAKSKQGTTTIEQVVSKP